MRDRPARVRPGMAVRGIGQAEGPSMHCDGCREEPVIHETIKDPVTGKLVEHHYCAGCPHASGLTGQTQGDPIDPAAELAKAVAGVVSAGATASVGVPLTDSGVTTPKCPGCGLSFSEFRRTGILGCGSCYEAFEDRLGPLIERAHEGATHHVGKVPKRALAEALAGDEAKRKLVVGNRRDATERIVSLSKQLDEAVRTEQFERAATLRDELARLRESLGEHEEGADGVESDEEGAGDAGT